MTLHDKKAIDAILRHCYKLRRSVEHLQEYERFVMDDDAADAAVLRLGQIGELAKKELSSEVKRDIATIPWNQMYGARNRIVRGYDTLDFKIIWGTMIKDIPALIQELELYLAKCQNEGDSNGISRMQLE